MKVCIIGCGAIGSLFAAHLGRQDNIEVWAYDPNESHARAPARGIPVKEYEAKDVYQLVGRIAGTANRRE